MVQSTRPSNQSTVTSATAVTLSDMGFSAAQINNARRGWVAVTGGDVRYFLNNETPTTSDGLLFPEGDTYQVNESSVQRLSMIAVSANANVVVELETYV